MYLLNEKLRNFFTTLMIVSVLCFIATLFYEANNLATDSTYFNFFLIYFSSLIILYFVYVIYPLLKVLFKRYGSFIQKIILVLVFMSLIWGLFFFESRFNLLYMLYLAIFLNFSSNIKNNGNESYIVSFPIEKYNYRHNFSKMVNSSSFNILMTIVLLTVVTAESLYFFNLYVILSIIPAIALVLSSVFYGKTVKSTDY